MLAPCYLLYDATASFQGRKLGSNDSAGRLSGAVPWLHVDRPLLKHNMHTLYLNYSDHDMYQWNRQVQLCVPGSNWRTSATWNRLRRRPCQKRNVRHLDCPLCSLRVNSWLPWDHHIVLVTTCVLWVHDRCPFRHRDVFVGLFGQAENDLPPCNQRYNCCRQVRASVEEMKALLPPEEDETCPFRNQDDFVGLVGQAEDDLPPQNQR